jgi:Protein of unknown function (DUF642)
MMYKILAVLCTAIAPCLAYAAPIFSDNFEGNTTGLNKIPTGWSISNGGTVDIVGTGQFGITCAGGAGNCIDLDGSSGKSGNLSSPNVTLQQNQVYTVSFDLSGNQRIAAQTDLVTVSLGGSSFALSILGNAAFGTHTFSFTPATTGTFNLSFLDNSSNNVGAILDNVSISPVPLPAAYALFVAGLGLFGAVARRRNHRTA